jgi:hypothetical protein
MTASRFLPFCVVILVIMTLSAGCIKPPEDSDGSTGNSGGSSWFSGGGKGTPGSTGGGEGKGGSTGTTTTAAPGGSGLLQPATPYPVEIPPPTTSSFTRLPDPTPELVEYVAIFHETFTLKQNTTAYSYTLERPPMVIEMCIRPNMTTRTIWYESSTGDRKETTETITTISPAAWFEVTVRDQASGTIVAQEGFARSYSVDTAKKLTIRSAGLYLIEFAGNDLSAELRIRVPKTASQAGTPLQNMSCGSLLL